jgi:DMSO/TMAO reductase YedYZ molybdopterin-dependent catalytic subunit
MTICFAAGSISNAEWTGVRVRDLARYIGLDPDKSAQIGARWVTSTGLDYHRKTQMHFETSISVDKAFDVKGDVIVAYAMNGKELLPDHGYPVSSILFLVCLIMNVPSVV